MPEATEIVDQPPPVVSTRPSVQSMVRADLEERERIGVQRYGTVLQAHNGRDALVDAYQEVLDLACYVRQELVEREDLRALGEAARAWRNGEISGLSLGEAIDAYVTATAHA